MRSLDEEKKLFVQKALSEGKNPKEVVAKTEDIARLYFAMQPFQAMAEGKMPAGAGNLNDQLRTMMSVAGAMGLQLTDSMKTSLVEAKHGVKNLLGDRDLCKRYGLSAENIENAKQFTNDVADDLPKAEEEKEFDPREDIQKQKEELKKRAIAREKLRRQIALREMMAHRKFRKPLHPLKTLDKKEKEPRRKGGLLAMLIAGARRGKEELSEPKQKSGLHKFLSFHAAASKTTAPKTQIAARAKAFKNDR